MAVEIEAKLSVPDHEPVRARLRECGATSAGSVLETNSFFDTEDRSLLAADEGLRLRKSVDNESHHAKFKLTFKGPRRHGVLKNRDEVELEVSSDSDAFNLLSCLGYLRVLSFEKRRESWTLGDCLIELDSLPHLGNFVEIEGPNEQIVLQVREQLRLNDRPIVKDSYIALLTAYLQEHGDSSRTITLA